jgi:hypothetical protein
VLSNNQMTDASRTAAELSAIVFGAPYHIPRILPAHILGRYVGRYEISPERIVDVTLKNGRLFAQGIGQGKTELFASAETQFFLMNADVYVNFGIDKQGNVTEMVVSKEGRETKAKRLASD